MNKTNQFVETSNKLLANTTLNFGQKLFISYILSLDNSKCYDTNEELAKLFGLKRNGIKSLLQSLKNYDFFIRKYDSVMFSRQEMTIDIDKLDEFIKINL